MIHTDTLRPSRLFENPFKDMDRSKARADDVIARARQGISPGDSPRSNRAVRDKRLRTQMRGTFDALVAVAKYHTPSSDPLSKYNRLRPSTR